VDTRVRWQRLDDLADSRQKVTHRTSFSPAKFITDPNIARLDKVRAADDPDGLLHSWMACG
jgi:hypothetical protein